MRLATLNRVTTAEFARMVARAELVALTMSHPAARAVTDAWCDMSHAQRLRSEADYSRLYCKLGPDGPCRCGQHTFTN